MTDDAQPAPRKKVLIVLNTMVCGGIEKSALTLFEAIPRERFEITLLLVHKTGEFLGLVPDWVKVDEVPLRPEDRHELLAGRRAALRQALRSGHLLRAVQLAARRLYCLAAVPEPRWRCVELEAMFDKAAFDSTVYDCAIAYSDAIQCVMLVSRRIRAKVKIAWFHTEYPPEFVKQENYLDYYRTFDHLFACSEALAAKMNAKLQGLSRPVVCFPHFLDAKGYAEKARAGKGFLDGYRGTRILSVGRLCEQKGFDLAVAVLARLVRAGHDVRWYVIGVGDDEQKLREAAAAAGLGERFCLLGVQTNPYPFFAGCDLYVQPSRYEGYCLTVAEARAFAKPIVCTDFAGAREQIVDGCTGLIVPCDEARIYEAVKRLLDEPELRETLSRNLRQTTVDTTHVIGRLVALMEG